MKLKLFGLLLALLLPAGSPCRGRQRSAPAKTRWWSGDVDKALLHAGTNRAELMRALEDVPAEQRKGMAFLVANMPERDLRALHADFLLENVALAYRARTQVAWGKRLPEEVFLNDVLPYVNVDEERHPWRKQLYDLCLPLVKDCKTPAEAAQLLNSAVFKKLQVRYSTQRKKPHQSPQESIAIKMASCTGLSILLSDACRSVAVPARLAGTPLWANKRGNHTWVEIWDNGWHFTGACEPDPRGLDRGWFAGDAAQAKKDSPLHAIYAASYKKTPVHFPLVWSPDRKDVFAENVTDRYATPTKTENRTRVHVRVWRAGKQERLAEPVEVVDRKDPTRRLHGTSRGETADTNDILTFDLLPGRDYLVRVGKPVCVEQSFKTTAGKQQFIDVEVPAPKPTASDKKGGLSKEQARQVEKAALAFFTATDAERAGHTFAAALDRLLAGHEAAVRRAVWKAYRAAPIHAAARKDFDQNQVRYQKHVSPYAVRRVGQRPEKGWPLFIALHGGGGAPKALNDSQWKIMQRYYRDQASVTGYQYLALRAPNDVWNGFYDDYVPPLVVNLIRQFLLFGDVDSDRVYLMGYSHGGYGAFFIGPKIPDHFAAIHSSAAAPTDGTISPLTLRNTRFTFMIGEKDNAYGRRERCEKFNAAVQKLKEENKGDFPVAMEFKKGFGHGGLPDRDKIKEMIAHTRNPVPRRLSWELTDSVVRDFFWLSVPDPSKGKKIDATVADNRVRIVTHDIKDFDLDLDGRLVAFDRPLHLSVDGKERTIEVRPSLLALCRSMRERGDPELACTCRVRLKGKKP